MKIIKVFADTEEQTSVAKDSLILTLVLKVGKLWDFRENKHNCRIFGQQMVSHERLEMFLTFGKNSEKKYHLPKSQEVCMLFKN